MEYRRIIILRIVYDNSDLQTDYFDNNHPLYDFYVKEMSGKRRTIGKLRRALKLLPELIQRLDWENDKTSYGKRFLTSSRVGDKTIKVYRGNSSPLWFTLEYYGLSKDSAFITHNKYERRFSRDKIPRSLKEFNYLADFFIASREDRKNENKRNKEKRDYYNLKDSLYKEFKGERVSYWESERALKTIKSEELKNLGKIRDWKNFVLEL